MNEGRKYETSGLIENQYQAGSGGRVLKNLFGINRKREIDRIEAQEQFRAIDELSKLFGEDHCFTAEDICRIHRIWLGRTYLFA